MTMLQKMKDRLGSRLLPADQIKKLTEAKKQGAERLGPRVLNPSPTPPVETAAEADANEDGKVSVSELRKALAEHPAMLDAMIESEMKREKPRKTALAALIEFEQGRTDQPARADVIARLTAAIG